MSTRRFPPVAVGLAVIGGLLIVGAASGHWVVAEERREVGGVVELAEPQGTSGTELAPQAVAVGVAGALAGLALIVARGRGRRAVGAVLVAAAVAAAAVVVAGAVRAAGEPGQLTPAPWVGLLGAAATGAGGVVAWRRPAPPAALGPRYRLEADPAADDEEWGLASDDG